MEYLGLIQKLITRTKKSIETANRIKTYGERGIIIDQGFNLNGKLIIEAPSSVLSCGVYGNCSVGVFTYLQPNGHIKNTKIGRYCSIAVNFMAAPGQHPYGNICTNPIFYDKSEFNNPLGLNKSRDHGMPIEIGHDVWIGNGCTVMEGVHIGTGAIIGTSAVVTKDVQPYEIVGGVPAKHIKWRFSQEVRDRLLASKWWEYDIPSLNYQGSFSDISLFLQVLEKSIAEGKVGPLIPSTHHFSQ